MTVQGYAVIIEQPGNLGDVTVYNFEGLETAEKYRDKLLARDPSVYSGQAMSAVRIDRVERTTMSIRYACDPSKEPERLTGRWMR